MQQSARLSDGGRAALWPHKPHLSGIRAQETAQMGTTNGLCLARLQLTNEETEPAAFPAPKTDSEELPPEPRGALRYEIKQPERLCGFSQTTEARIEFYLNYK